MAEEVQEQEVPKSLTVDEQDDKYMELAAPLLDAFNSLPDRQKLQVVAKYIERHGAFPTPPEEPALTTQQPA